MFSHSVAGVARSYREAIVGVARCGIARAGAIKARKAVAGMARSYRMAIVGVAHSYRGIFATQVVAYLV